jgi:hypothetical protein
MATSIQHISIESKICEAAVRNLLRICVASASFSSCSRKKRKLMGTAMAKRLFLAVWLVTLTGGASASAHVSREPVFESIYKPGKGMVCPELDPSSVVSGLSLVAAGLAVWRGRKGKKTDDQ